MTPRPAPLTQTAERRASLEVRGPVSRSIGREGAVRRSSSREAAGPVRQPGAGLTLRERRIKAILLKELEKVNGRDYGAGLSYNEKQKLEKTLDVDYIDAELAKMDRTQRNVRRFRNWAAIPLAVAAVAFVVWNLAMGQPLDALFPALTPALLLVSFVQQSKAVRRRRWIYEALRELSDADDLDVQLPESVAWADLLIDRIVEAEEEASAVPLRRTRA